MRFAAARGRRPQSPALRSRWLEQQTRLRLGIKGWTYIEISMPVYSLYYRSQVSQLLAQRRDYSVYHISANVVFEAPYIVQKFNTRNRFTLPRREVAHHVELFSRQNGRTAVHHKSSSSLIE